MLNAAGESAARGVEGVGSPEWTFVRKVTVMPNVRMGQDGPKVTFTTQHETWTSSDNRHNFSIIESSAPGAGAWPSLHYENLAAGTIGDVQWARNGGGLGPRRASWTVQPMTNGQAGGDATIEMMVELRERLPKARASEDVAEVIDDVLDIGAFTYRNGAACSKQGCHSWGSYMGPLDGIAPEVTRTMYGRGLLLNALAFDVYPPEATLAIYRYLAELEGTTVRALDDGTSNVELLFPAPGAPAGTGERVVLDGDTGRIIERGRETNGGSTRWTAVGASDEPVVGGGLCAKYPAECEELRDLAARLEHDPKAQFDGVVDWMFISQFCDGMIGRDGKPVPGNDELPHSMSKDPKVKAEREACEKREAAAARGD